MDPSQAVRDESADLSRGDLEAVLSYYTDDVYFEDVSVPTPCRTKAEMRDFMKVFYDAFPDLHAAIDDIFAEGDKVVYRWSVEGTFENEIMGLQPTGERGSPVRGITIDRYEGDRIAESWSQWDTLTFMRDIGAIPSEAAASAGS